MNTVEKFYFDEESPEIEVEVKVNITLSKTVTVKVKDYDIVENDVEEGEDPYDLDFTGTNFLAAVEEQIVLPQNASLYVDIGENLKAANDLSGWHVDKIECIKE